MISTSQPLAPRRLYLKKLRIKSYKLKSTVKLLVPKLNGSKDSKDLTSKVKPFFFNIEMFEISGQDATNLPLRRFRFRPVIPPRVRKQRTREESLFGLRNRRISIQSHFPRGVCLGKSSPFFYKTPEESRDAGDCVSRGLIDQIKVKIGAVSL